MKKRIFTTTLLVIVMILSYLTFVFAANLQTANKRLDELQAMLADNNKGVQLIDLEQQSQNYEYKKSKTQSALYKKQVLLYEFSNSQYGKRRDDKIALEKYNFQVSYYNTCLYIKQLSLLNLELSLINKQIEAEEEKVALGLSTELAVRELKSKRRLIQDKISKTSNSIEVSKDSLKSSLSVALNEGFSPIFEIPAAITNIKSYTLANLTALLLNNNTELNSVLNSITAQNSLIQELQVFLNANDNELMLARAELNKLQLEESTLRSGMEQYAKQKHYEYTQAYTNVNSLQEKKAILNEKLQILIEEHAEGVHSDLDFEAYKLDIENQLYEAEAAIVQHLNAGAYLELIAAGIWVR